MAQKAKSSKQTVKKTSLSESSKVNVPAKEAGKKNVKVVAIIAIIVVLIFLFAYLSKGLFVAATVNGEPISRIAVIKVLEKQSGSMVLENMITKKLILQEAKTRNIDVTKEDLDNEIKTISESLKKQGTTLEKALEAQGMTREELNDELRVQLALRKLTEKDIKVTEHEVEDFVTTNADQFAEGTSDEEKRELARAQLEQQKSSEKSQALLEELKKKAKILQFAGY